MTKLATWAIWLRYLHIQAKHEHMGWANECLWFLSFERMTRTISSKLCITASGSESPAELQLMKMFNPIPEIEILSPLTLPHTLRVQYVAGFFVLILTSVTHTHKKKCHMNFLRQTHRYSLKFKQRQV